MISIRSPQNLGAACVLSLLGALGLVFGADLEVGTAAQMGPGYFPMVLSWGLIVFAAVALARAVTLPGPKIALPKLRPLLFILAAILVFGGLVRPLGLALIGAAVVVIAAFAQRRVAVRETALLAVGMSAFAIALFIFVLGLPLTVWGG